jgi:hypothetical protein
MAMRLRGLLVFKGELMRESPKQAMDISFIRDQRVLARSALSNGHLYDYQCPVPARYLVWYWPAATASAQHSTAATLAGTDAAQIVLDLH